MTDLIKISAELLAKQSHVRSSFVSLLEAWEEATKDDLNDKNLEHVYLGEISTGIDESEYLFILRADDNLFVMNSYTLMHESFNEALDKGTYYAVNIEYCDMKYIRTALGKFPEAITKHAEELQKEGEKYDELLAIVSKK